MSLNGVKRMLLISKQQRRLAIYKLGQLKLGEWFMKTFREDGAPNKQSHKKCNENRGED